MVLMETKSTTITREAAMTIKKRNRIITEAIKGMQDANYARVNGLVTATARGFSAQGISGLAAVNKLLDDIECAEFVARQVRKYGSAADVVGLEA
jgi:hypothetical protein